MLFDKIDKKDKAMKIIREKYKVIQMLETERQNKKGRYLKEIEKIDKYYNTKTNAIKTELVRIAIDNELMKKEDVLVEE